MALAWRLRGVDQSHRKSGNTFSLALCCLLGYWVASQMFRTQRTLPREAADRAAGLQGWSEETIGGGRMLSALPHPCQYHHMIRCPLEKNSISAIPTCLQWRASTTCLLWKRNAQDFKPCFVVFFQLKLVFSSEKSTEKGPQWKAPGSTLGVAPPQMLLLKKRLQEHSCSETVPNRWGSSSFLCLTCKAAQGGWVFVPLWRDALGGLEAVLVPGRSCGEMGHGRAVGWGGEVGTWGGMRDCGEDQWAH